MSILFVLLTFLLIMSITYFLRREQPARHRDQVVVGLADNTTVTVNVPAGLQIQRHDRSFTALALDDGGRNRSQTRGR